MNYDDEVMWAQSLTGDDFQCVHVDAWNEAKDEIAKLKAEIDRFRALIAEIDKRTMFEAYGMGNSFADSIDCLVQCGGKCPTVEEAYARALCCEKHK
jgi:hypothetical protein